MRWYLYIAEQDIVLMNTVLAVARRHTRAKQVTVYTQYAQDYRAESINRN